MAAVVVRTRAADSASAWRHNACGCEVYRGWPTHDRFDPAYRRRLVGGKRRPGSENRKYLHDGDVIAAGVATDDKSIDLGLQRTVVRFT